ncbi:hypothetical protein [Brunnivagina elsteri]|uniref:hypothetical protein n=1 Tax=Brunnivagina elsteri TaxID=1247191 RepID=UPI0013047C25|nr:hypothetical protein [Calothrix elsteri]
MIVANILKVKRQEKLNGKGISQNNPANLQVKITASYSINSVKNAKKPAFYR